MVGVEDRHFGNSSLNNSSLVEILPTILSSNQDPIVFERTSIDPSSLTPTNMVLEVVDSEAQVDLK